MVRRRAATLSAVEDQEPRTRIDRSSASRTTLARQSNRMGGCPGASGRRQWLSPAGLCLPASVASPTFADPVAKFRFGHARVGVRTVGHPGGNVRGRLH